MLDIRPVSDLRNHYPDIERAAQDTGQPIVLTKNGKNSMVLVSFDKFSQLAHLDYIERALDEADLYATNHAEDLTHEDVFLKARARLRG